jgi:hypothetical protein
MCENNYTYFFSINLVIVKKKMDGSKIKASFPPSVSNTYVIAEKMHLL